MASFSMGSINKVLTTNGDLFEPQLPALGQHPIPERTKISTLDRVGYLRDLNAKTQNHFPSAFSGSSQQLCERGQYYPHFMDGETEGQSK